MSSGADITNDELRDRWLEHATSRIREAGLRAGATRTAVIELLARDGQCLVGAQEINEILRRDGVGSIASVYRVLDELLSLGLVHRFIDRDSIARYEIADPDNHHHHLVDERTGQVEPFTDAHLEDAIRAVAQRLGLELTSHEVVLRGHR